MFANRLWTAALTLSMVFGCVSYANAQEKANPFASNIIGTLANPKMARELELLDEQQERLRELMKEFGQLQKDVREDLTERWIAADEETREELKKEYGERVEEGRLEIVKEMKANLLPHQIDRLEQLSAQRMMQEGKGRDSAGLLSNQMVDYLDITPDQQKRIKEKSQQLRQEIGEKIRKIVEDAKQELLAELTAKQKARYEKLLGDPIAEVNNESQSRKDGSRKPGRRN